MALRLFLGNSSSFEIPFPNPFVNVLGACKVGRSNEIVGKLMSNWIQHLGKDAATLLCVSSVLGLYSI